LNVGAFVKKALTEVASNGSESAVFRHCLWLVGSFLEGKLVLRSFKNIEVY
jgi:hypothetical protein